MSGKRFIEPYEDCRVIKNTQTGETATYYDTEDGLMFLKWLNNLSDENEQLKQQISYYEKLITDKEVEWLRDNTVWEQMPTNKRIFTKTRSYDLND